MIPGTERTSRRACRPLRLLLILLPALLAALAGGCADIPSFKREPFRPAGVRLWLVPRNTHLPDQPVSAPFTRLGDRPVIEVKIDGKGPYRMMLDTGTEGVLVSPGLARDLRLSELSATFRVHGDQDWIGARHPHVRRIRSLEIGGAQFEEVAALPIERVRRDRLDGVVGLSVFNQCLLTIDYSADQIILTRGRLPPPDGHDLLPARRWSNHAVLWVTAEVGGKPLPMLIDSGWSGPMQVASGDATRLSFAYGPVPSPFKTFPLAGPPRYDRIGRLKDDLRLGRHTFTTPIVGVAADETKLAAHVLKEFTVTLDQRSMVVQFKRDDNEPIRMGRARHLGFEGLRKPGAWSVGPPARGISLEALGLREGDRIVEVNGKPVTNRTDRELLYGDDTTVTYTVEREGGRIVVKAPVITLVP